MDALNSISGVDKEGEDMPQDRASPSDDDHQSLNPVSPEEGYELYRYKNAEGMKTKLTRTYRASFPQRRPPKMRG